ncbi:MAG TPA: hypothetical protein VFT64_12120 [Rickettsiales bacterium]|nr:hypothetical protein [Rickettsiales bacterium]
MAPISPRDFFEAAEDRRTAVPVITIWHVQAGETVYVGRQPLATQTVEEPGWYVVSPEVSRVTTQDEADDEYLPYRIEPSTIPRQEIGTITVQRIAAHEEYMVGEIAHRAVRDGYLLSDGETVVFLSRLYYEALFGNQGRMDGCELIANDEPIEYIVLTEPVTLAFREGPFEAEAGMVLFEDWQNRRGFGIASWLAFLADHAPAISA